MKNINNNTGWYTHFIIYLFYYWEELTKECNNFNNYFVFIFIIAVNTFLIFRLLSLHCALPVEDSMELKKLIK